MKTIIDARKAEGADATPGVVAVFDPMGTVRSFHVEDGCERGAPDIAFKVSLTISIRGNSVEEGKRGTRIAFRK